MRRPSCPSCPSCPRSNYRPWFYNTTIASEKFMHQKPLLFGPALSFAEAGTLFGGHVVDYSHNMSFVTVHGRSVSCGYIRTYSICTADRG